MPNQSEGSGGEAVCVLALRPTARVSRCACLSFSFWDGTLETTSGGGVAHQRDAENLCFLVCHPTVSEGSDWRVL